MDDNERTEWGLLRYGAISGIIAQTHPGVSKEALYREAASRTYVLPNGKTTQFTAATVKDWHLKYVKGGFAALLPNQRIDLGKSRALTDEMITHIGELKAEFPLITGQKLWETMIERGYIRATDVSVDTIQRYLRNNGLKTPPSDDPHLPFEFDHVNDCWQADTVNGPDITTLDGEVNPTFLISILDDHSRYIVAGRFYFADNAVNMQKTMRIALGVAGIPKMLLMDHGGSYDNLEFRRICADAGIGAVYCKPYKPQGKGKEERSHRTMNDRFLNCTSFADCHDLDALNAKYETFLNKDYAEHVNRMTKETPRERFMAEYASLRFVDAAKLDFIFLHSDNRTLYSDSTIQFDKKRYEVPQAYIAGMKSRKEKIPIRFKPEDSSELYIVDEKEYKILYTLKEPDLSANTKRNRKNPIDFDVAGAD